MTLIVDVKDENGKTIVHESFSDFSKFYLGTINKNGQFNSFGKLPNKKVFLNSVRSYAKKWAEGQDLSTFFQELRQMLTQESIRRGNLEAQICLQAETFCFKADELRSKLIEVKQESADFFRQKYGKEGGFVFFNTAWEMMMAMIRRLKEENMKVYTIWVYPTLPLGKSETATVLEWLFRKVESDGKY